MPVRRCNSHLIFLSSFLIFRFASLNNQYLYEMKSNLTKYRTGLLYVLQLLLIILFSFSNSFANIVVTVNGQANGAAFPQASIFQWNINGLANGAVVSNQLWIDLNGNGVIDPATDLLFVSFSETDGVAGGNDGPGDDDGIANGTISTSISGLSFPVRNYIFKSTSGIDSATSTFSITPMVSPTLYVSGKVTKGGNGMPNIVVRVEQSPNEYYALTDANGNYSVTTNLPAGTAVSVNVPTESFNSSLNGEIITPFQTDFILNSNVSGINFTITKAKMVTGFVSDTLGNAIAGLAINIYPANGGNGHNGRTDANGRDFISVDTGTYTVQFGSDQEPKGYIKTYYNQKNVGWLSDNITVVPSTDTLKNINAVIRNGGLIMGTFKNNGVSVRGNITAFLYNAAGNPQYEAWHDNTENFYYLFVPPGTYTIQFNLENGTSQVYYNQTFSWPGTAVTINSLSDTMKNINVDFSTVHKKYTFTGNGNWNSAGNWTNNLMPPSQLPSGDSIIINHIPGGQCFLNVPLNILPGGSMIVAEGKNLIIPGDLKLQ